MKQLANIHFVQQLNWTKNQNNLKVLWTTIPMKFTKFHPWMRCKQETEEKYCQRIGDLSRGGIKFVLEWKAKKVKTILMNQNMMITF